MGSNRHLQNIQPIKAENTFLSCAHGTYQNRPHPGIKTKTLKRKKGRMHWNAFHNGIKL